MAVPPVADEYQVMPVPVAEILAFPAPHLVEPVTTGAVGMALISMAVVAVAEQSPLPLIVTEYVPAIAKVTFVLLGFWLADK